MEIKCEIMRLKKDKINEYIDIHLNPWPELIEEIKNSEIFEEHVFIVKNIVIVIIRANDVKNTIKNLQKKEICKKWSSIVKKMLTKKNNIKLPEIDVINTRCIFEYSKRL